MSSRHCCCPSRPKALYRRIKLQSYAVISLICSGALLVAPISANANPKDGQVAAGTATITQTSPNRLDINQQSQKAIINWKSFSIGQNETTNFNQPNASSITLNRVTGVDPSTILGNLTANGQVWLVNPNGIVFGKTARVDVSGLLATTLDISDSDFMSGRYKFPNAAATGAMVANEGELTVRQAGLAALVAPWVENSGVIQANLGHVQLSSAAGFTLDLYGDGLFNFLLDDKVTEAIAGPDGFEPVAAVANSGQLIADGGRVVLSANTAKSVIDHAINMDGFIQASSVKESNGVIILDGGSEGVVEVSGTLDASAPNGGDGGFIETSGAFVEVADTATVTTAAADGKAGTWLIDPNDFTIAATGGNISGSALSANLANNSVTISTAPQFTTTQFSLVGGNGDIFVNDAVTWSANTTLALDAERNIEVNANITATGNTAGLTLGYGSGGEYSITSGKKITLSGSAPVLKIGTAGSEQTYIVINSLGVEGDSSAMTLQGMKNNLSGRYALGSDIDASATSGWNSGAGFEPVGNFSSYFTGIFDGLGHTVTGLTINRLTENLIGLFGSINYGFVRNVGLTGGSVTGKGHVGGLMGVNYGTITNSYSTGSVTGDISVGGLVGGNGYSGTISNSYSTGSVNGRATVGGLVGGNSGAITESYSACSVTGNWAVGGLAGYNWDTIIDSYSLGGVTGDNRVGGLVGVNSEGNIFNSYSIGTVTGNYELGGLVGEVSVNSTITKSYSTGNVIGNNTVGGLVGANSGAITESYSACTVTGNWAVGGLVGANHGVISNSYSTSAVNGNNYVGGLLGVGDGTISNSYSIGMVTGDSTVGGLVGHVWLGSTLNINNSYWDTETSGQATSVGGTGLTTAQLKSGLPVGFDSAIWAIRADVNSGYPYLQWQSVSAPEPTPAPQAPNNDDQITALNQCNNVSPDRPILSNLQKELGRAKKREANFPDPPKYFYEVGIATEWMKATGSITGTKDLKKLYNEIYDATLEYHKLARLYLDNANSALENKDAALAQYYLDKHDRYVKILQYSGEAALITYDGNLEASKEFAKGIQKASFLAVKYGTIFAGAPIAGALLNKLVAVTDFVVDWNEGGLSFALKEELKGIVIDALVTTPVAELNGKSISSAFESFLENNSDSFLFVDVFERTLKSPEAQEAMMQRAIELSSKSATRMTKGRLKGMLGEFHPDFFGSPIASINSANFTPLTKNFGKPAVNIFGGGVSK